MLTFWNGMAIVLAGLALLTVFGLPRDAFPLCPTGELDNARCLQVPASDGNTLIIVMSVVIIAVGLGAVPYRVIMRKTECEPTDDAVTPDDSKTKSQTIPANTHTEYRLAIIPEIGATVIDSFENRRDRAWFGQLILAVLYVMPQDLGRICERPDEFIALMDAAYGHIRTGNFNYGDTFVDIMADSKNAAKSALNQNPHPTANDPFWDDVLIDLINRLRLQGYDDLIGRTEVDVLDYGTPTGERARARRLLSHWPVNPNLSIDIVERESQSA